MLKRVDAAVRSFGNSRLDERGVKFDRAIGGNIDFDLLMKDDRRLDEIVGEPELAFGDRLHDRLDVASFNDIADGEAANRDVLFMQICVHRGVACDLGGQILCRVDRSFDYGAIRLANANVLQVECFVGDRIGKCWDALGGHGGFGLDAYASGSIERDAAVGFAADSYGDVFDDDGFAGIFGRFGFGVGMRLCRRQRGRRFGRSRLLSGL